MTGYLKVQLEAMPEKLVLSSRFTVPVMSRSLNETAVPDLTNMVALEVMEEGERMLMAVSKMTRFTVAENGLSGLVANAVKLTFSKLDEMREK